MIESIHIQNFQKHEEIHVEFDRITTLVGASGKGKTAILRALRWSFIGKPVGDAFIRHGADLCRVEIGVDGKTVVREKGHKTNSYTLDGKTYEAFGAGNVPDEIAALFNVDHRNFQNQHDPFYLLPKSASDVGKELNSVVDLSLIDSTLYNLSAEVRKAKTTEQVCKDRYKASRKERDNLQWVVGLDEQLKEVEELESINEAKRHRQQAMECLLSEIQQAEQAAASTIPWDEIQEVDGQLQALQQKQQRLQSMQSLLQQIEDVEQQCQKAKMSAFLSDAAAQQSAGQTCPMCQRPLPKKKSV